MRALAAPILCALQVQLHVAGFLFRPVRADLLDEPPVARAAAIGHDNTEHRRVLRPDAFHTDSDCHKFFSSSAELVASTRIPPLPQKGAQRLVTAGIPCKPCFGLNARLPTQPNAGLLASGMTTTAGEQTFLALECADLSAGALGSAGILAGAVPGEE